MKKFYFLLFVLIFNIPAFAQLFTDQGKHYVKTTNSVIKHVLNERMLVCGDTIGISNVTDFVPEFASISGQATNYGYLGGGYIYGNNVSANDLKICAQGYVNLNNVPVQVIAALLWFAGKESDAGGSPASRVTISGYNMGQNIAYNTNSSGTFNSTTPNWEGPTGVALCTSNLTYANIDTTGYNYVSFASPATFLGDFALSMDVSLLVNGDTVGLVSDSQNDAQNLDLAYHKIGAKWFVTDQLFSSAAAPDLGSGALDNDIAMWPIVCDITGVNEYFNGMKLTNYPNPSNEKTTIEYALEKASAQVNLLVFDLKGRKLIDNKYSNQAAGIYKIDISTLDLTSGQYFYQLNANGINLTKRLIVTR